MTASIDFNFFRLFRRRCDTPLHWESALGAAISVLCRTKNGRMRDLSFVERILKPAFDHNQLEIFYNEDGTPVAYVAWALLSEHCKKRLTQTTSEALHYSEWNEGPTVWLMDFAIVPNHLRQALSFFRDEFFSDVAEVGYARQVGAKYKHVAISPERRGYLCTVPSQAPACRCGKSPCSLAYQ